MMMTTLRRSLSKGTLLFLFFSFSFLAAAFSAPTIPVSKKENPGSLPVLISLDHVAKDLHLTSLQKSVIAGLRNDYRAAAMKLTEEEKVSAKTTELQTALDHLSEKYNERVLALLNPHQRQRLRQIERQVLQGTILVTPSEQQFLSMSVAQKKRIAAIACDADKKAAAINLQASQGKIRYHQQVAALRKNRLQHAHAMLKVLTPAQLKKWKEAQGNKLLF